MEKRVLTERELQKKMNDGWVATPIGHTDKDDGKNQQRRFGSYFKFEKDGSQFKVFMGIDPRSGNEVVIETI